MARVFNPWAGRQMLNLGTLFFQRDRLLATKLSRARVENPCHAVAQITSLAQKAKFGRAAIESIPSVAPMSISR